MRHVISYCKSHMQITKRAPRLHQTYGFEVRSEQLTLQKRCTVEQSTFANTKLLIIPIACSSFGHQNCHFNKANRNILDLAMQRVISYCKSHMQMTKHSPRLHQTYGFELRIHSRPFKKRYTVEQSTFAKANSLKFGCVVEACNFRNSRTPLTKRSFPVDKDKVVHPYLVLQRKRSASMFGSRPFQDGLPSNY